MRIRKIKTKPEEQLLLGMIVSDRILRETQSIYQPELIKLPFVKTVAHWCQEYLKENGTAPGKHIEDIFFQKLRADQIQEDQAELIEKFLGRLSDQYDGSINEDFILSQTEKYLQEQQLRQQAEDIAALLDQGKLEEARSRIEGHVTICRPSSESIDPYIDKEAIRKAFEFSADPLFKLPGAVGRLLNSQFTRDAFISFQGPEKIGKTWWLMYLAHRARRARRNVAFFQAGDLSLNQQVLRFGILQAGKSNHARYCGKFLIPVLDCEYNQDNTCDNKRRACDFGVLLSDPHEKEREYMEWEEADMDGYKPCTYCLRRKDFQYKGAVWHKMTEIPEPLTDVEAYRIGKKHNKQLKGTKFKLECYPIDTLNINRIEARLQYWSTSENFIPDVIVIDYADILDCENVMTKDFRHRINETWKAMRKLSQNWNCCVITATQADAQAYKKGETGRLNFSEDKRKYAHVTASYGFSQSPKEKEQGLLRIGALVVREDDFNELKKVRVLQSIRSGKPCLGSFF